MLKLSEIKDEELKEAVRMFNPYVSKNVELETSDDIAKFNKTGHLYHIGINLFKKFIPIVSKRMREEEDNTLLRLHVAADLLHCLMGYNTFFEDYLDPTIGFDKEWKLKNFFYFHIFEFEYCLKPNEVLVPDAKFTEERWMFPFNRETKHFVPLATLEVAIKDIKVERKEGLFSMDVIFNVNNKSNQIIAIDYEKNKTISKGTYDIALHWEKVSPEKQSYEITSIKKTSEKVSLEDASSILYKW